MAGACGLQHAGVGQQRTFNAVYENGGDSELPDAFGPRCANYRVASEVEPKTGRIYECNRADDRCKRKALLTTCGESPYTLVRFE